MLKHICMAFLLIVLVAFSGCKGLTPDQKTKVSTCSAVAKDLASSFSVIGPGLAPADPNDATPVANWVIHHQNGLNEEAAAMDQAVQAIKNGSTLSQQSRDLIGAAVATSAIRISTFKAMRGKLKLTDAQNTWADVHVAQLTNLNNDITALVASLTPTPTPAPAAPAVTKGATP